MINRFFIILAVFFIPVLSGCSKPFSNSSEQARVYEERHPITLEQIENNLEVPITDEQIKLTNIQKAKIKGFLYKYNQNSKDNLIITVPEDGFKAPIAKRLVKEIVDIVDRIGIDKDYIKIGTYKPLVEGIGSIRINFESLIAKAPECNDMWSENLADAYSNEISKGLGCATRNNLAAMVVRPKDLIQMPTISPGHAGRRVGMFDKYILGQNTNASKGETASATDQ